MPHSRYSVHVSRVNMYNTLRSTRDRHKHFNSPTRSGHGACSQSSNERCSPPSERLSSARRSCREGKEAVRKRHPPAVAQGKSTFPRVSTEGLRQSHLPGALVPFSECGLCVVFLKLTQHTSQCPDLGNGSLQGGSGIHIWKRLMFITCGRLGGR